MNQTDYKAISRGVSDDMSSEAIAHRLRIAGQLWKLGNSLMDSTYAGKVADQRPAHNHDESLPQKPTSSGRRA